MKKELITSAFLLFPFSRLMAGTEQVAEDITNNFYLVDDLTGMFFFHLLLDKPLEHLKWLMIFLPDGKVYEPVPVDDGTAAEK